MLIILEYRCPKVAAMNHWYVPRMIIVCFVFVVGDGFRVQLNILGFARRVKWYRGGLRTCSCAVRVREDLEDLEDLVLF